LLKNYVFEELTLGDLLQVLTAHQFSLEGLRAMTMTEIYDGLKRVNAGEIKSFAELDAEDRARKVKK
jgi:hypothetical protein